MGANLVPGGATFRVFAPRARAVYINGIFDGVSRFQKDQDDSLLLVNKNNYWAGFLRNAKEGDQYLFYVVGKGHSDFKRDPYARELTSPGNFPESFSFPSCNCVIRDPNRYQWHDQGFRPPAFNDLAQFEKPNLDIPRTDTLVEIGGLHDLRGRVDIELLAVWRVQYVLCSIYTVPTGHFHKGTASQGSFV